MPSRPPQCHNEITPNDMHTSLSCAWSGAFIICGGLIADVWGTSDIFSAFGLGGLRRLTLLTSIHARPRNASSYLLGRCSRPQILLRKPFDRMGNHRHHLFSHHQHHWRLLQTRELLSRQLCTFNGRLLVLCNRFCCNLYSLTICYVS